MPRLPARLAARIDRLACTAHRFHRFAHHPLCDEYRGEVVRLGRRNRLCRGCLLVGSGSVGGLALSVLLPAPPAALAVLGAFGLAGVVYATTSRRSKSRARAPKLVSRFLPALAIAYALGRAVQFGLAGGAFAAVCAIPLLGLVTRYRRRGPDRTPCASCPERNQSTPCRGIAPIVRRERAFRRLAGQWLAGVGP
jgi:hypothetical protein